jgi:hypothetical protein
MRRLLVVSESRESHYTARQTAASIGTFSATDKSLISLDRLWQSGAPGGNCARHPGEACRRINTILGVMGLAEVRLQEGESLENALRRFKRKIQTEGISLALLLMLPACANRSTSPASHLVIPRSCITDMRFSQKAVCRSLQNGWFSCDGIVVQTACVKTKR